MRIEFYPFKYCKKINGQLNLYNLFLGEMLYKINFLSKFLLKNTIMLLF
jgi:hypothetical protein